MSGNARKVLSPVNEAFAAEMIGIAAYRASDEGTFINVKDLLPDNVKASFSKIFSK
jgi:hypothetical protein